jgi:two-component system nitrogen regulation response regulator GlnG
MPLQSKILRVLQDGEFSRVGGNTSIKTHARIVAATNRNLEQEVQRKTFREDLFYRLNVVRIHLPPLRERKQDIRLLADYFLQKIAREKGLPRVYLSEEAATTLEHYRWPGNIRELENTIQRAVVLATTEVLLPKDIPLGDNNVLNMGTGLGQNPAAPEHAPADPDSPIPAEREAAYQTNGDSEQDHADPSAEEGTEETTGNPVQKALDILLEHAEADPELQLLPWVEREMTKYAMQKTGGNQVRSAQLLGVTRATLRKRIERFGITKELKVK